MRQVTEGYLCLFTLKNPSYPEYINSTESGVMCLDFHPQHPYLVVVGLYDGTVAVYNIQLPTKERQFQSNSVTNKHGGIVWQVQLFTLPICQRNTGYSLLHTLYNEMSTQ